MYYVWAYSLVAVIVAIALGAIMTKIVRHFQNWYLRRAMILIGLYCRAENNKLYLPNNIELRPGYLGKWLEFHVHGADLPTDIILEGMKNRWQQKVKYSDFLRTQLARVKEKSKAKKPIPPSCADNPFSDLHYHQSNDQLLRDVPVRNESHRHQILLDH
jgi:hypothetical protein